MDAWLKARGWRAAGFQREAWRAMAAGQSGLVHAPTGSGKTLALWLGALARALDPATEAADRPPLERLRWLWITPLRALSADSERALAEPLADLASHWRIQRRTGDTAASQRALWARRSPELLVTTPESLSLLLSHPDAPRRFGRLEGMIVDEWHELLGSKRGTQTELVLARLRHWNPAAMTWGLSATLGNPAEAMQALVGPKRPGRLIQAPPVAAPRIETLAPADIERFPWSGHLGVRLVDQVADRIEAAASTLVFVNTRSQVELWLARLQETRPDWEKRIAAHHGSLDRARREEIEAGLRAGRLKAVVCTSTLDLGIDFPVAQVLQIGSPKGVARLLQRAGRSGHRPGESSRIIGVPTHAFELVEFAAAREAVDAGRVEARLPLARPLDVLVQHLVSCALGGGFSRRGILAELRDTVAYQGLTAAELDWALTFITRGGDALGAYPEFRRVKHRKHRYVMQEGDLARRHRQSIGTIVNEVSVTLKMSNGHTLGVVEEGFAAKLKPGSPFRFGGRLIELVRIRGLVATVRPARARRAPIATWQGAKFSFSTALADEVRQLLGRAAASGEPEPHPEMALLRPLLEVQRQWSRIPAPGELLIETTATRDAEHWFVFTFGGWLGNEGLSQLVSWRIARQRARTLVTSVNDYGFELSSADPLGLDASDWLALLTPAGLAEDLVMALNVAGLARRQFREISRIAGLVWAGHPGRRKAERQLQMSSGLLWEVLERYDPGNLLLDQARREILERQLEMTRLQALLVALRRRRLVIQPTPRLTPFAFPLWAQAVATHHFSNEDPATRIAAMLDELEQRADRD